MTDNDLDRTLAVMMFVSSPFAGLDDKLVNSILEHGAEAHVRFEGLRILNNLPQARGYGLHALGEFTLQPTSHASLGNQELLIRCCVEGVDYFARDALLRFSATGPDHRVIFLPLDMGVYDLSDHNMARVSDAIEDRRRRLREGAVGDPTMELLSDMRSPLVTTNRSVFAATMATYAEHFQREAAASR